MSEGQADQLRLEWVPGVFAVCGLDAGAAVRSGFHAAPTALRAVEMAMVLGSACGGERSSTLANAELPRTTGERRAATPPGPDSVFASEPACEPSADESTPRAIWETFSKNHCMSRHAA